MSQTAVTKIPDDEAAIAAGTRLLRPADLAPRLGLSPGREGRRQVIARAKAGLLPHMRPSRKVFLFRWPDVIAAMTKATKAGSRP